MKIEMMELLSDKIDDIDLLKNVIEILDNMSLDDRMKIFEELKKHNYNKFICYIAADKDVSNLRTTEEQIKLMEELKNCDYNENASKIARNIGVLREVTNEEQIKLMEELKNCDYNENAYQLATHGSILRKRTVEKQIKLMKKIYLEELENQKTAIHSENMRKISNVTEFKMYLNELKQELGKDTDVKADTVVLKFTPDKNKERKEN